MSLKAAEFTADAIAEGDAYMAELKQLHIGHLAEDLMSGTEIWYRTPDYVRHKLTIASVARRYINMLQDGEYKFAEESIATLFGTSGENASLVLSDGYDAAVSLIEQQFESIIELMQEDV